MNETRGRQVTCRRPKISPSILFSFLSKRDPQRKEGQTHIAEIARPILCAFLSNPQLNLDLELTLAEDLLRTVLIHVLRFAPNQDG